jgi:hypothetical protein
MKPIKTVLITILLFLSSGCVFENHFETDTKDPKPIETEFNFAGIAD